MLLAGAPIGALQCTSGCYEQSAFVCSSTGLIASFLMYVCAGHCHLSTSTQGTLASMQHAPSRANLAAQPSAGTCSLSSLAALFDSNPDNISKVLIENDTAVPQRQARHSSCVLHARRRGAFRMAVMTTHLASPPAMGIPAAAGAFFPNCWSSLFEACPTCAP